MPKSCVFILVEYKKMATIPFKSSNEVAYENITRLCEADQCVFDLQKRILRILWVLKSGSKTKSFIIPHP